MYFLCLFPSVFIKQSSPSQGQYQRIGQIPDNSAIARLYFSSCQYLHSIFRLFRPTLFIFISQYGQNCFKILNKDTKVIILPLFIFNSSILSKINCFVVNLSVPGTGGEF